MRILFDDSVPLWRWKGRCCPLCGVTMTTQGKNRAPKPTNATRDHFIPKSLVLDPNSVPVIVTCRRCNNDKDNKMPHAWLGELEAAGDVRASKLRAIIECLEQGIRI